MKKIEIVPPKIKQTEMTPELLLFSLQGIIFILAPKFTPVIAGIGGMVLGVQPMAHFALFMAGLIGLPAILEAPKLDPKVEVISKTAAITALFGTAASTIYLLGCLVA